MKIDISIYISTPSDDDNKRIEKLKKRLVILPKAVAA